MYLLSTSSPSPLPLLSLTPHLFCIFMHDCFFDYIVDIKPGVYYGHVSVPSLKTFIKLSASDPSTTIISFNNTCQVNYHIDPIDCIFFTPLLSSLLFLAPSCLLLSIFISSLLHLSPLTCFVLIIAICGECYSHAVQ